MARFKRVAVLMGGVSTEREISLLSGKAVLDGLVAAGYDAVPHILESESIGELPAGVEAVFLALHGGYGESGGAQADLDRMGVPYTGSGAAASRMAMDKILSKRLFDRHAIPSARWAVVEAGDDRMPFPAPLVAKTPEGGSSVGVGIALAEAGWPAALAEARRYGGDVLAERFIPGREWTVGILDGEALPAIEIQAPEWYDFAAKYKAHGTTRYVFPEDPADRELVARCQDIARSVFRAFGARGLGRVDFRITPGGEPFVLELNTLPGFTSTSLLPKAAAKAGLPFPGLCARVMETAAFDTPTKD
ncbi:MAG: D-alanine--D-alanine ligase [Kiritimatiellia bacterium]|jgi:D-alanine-D-alanine ligase